MPDRTERVVTEALPTFESAVAKRASHDHSLSQLVPVVVHNSTLPVRQTGPLRRCLAGRDLRVSRLSAPLEWAYEIRHCATFSLTQLEAPGQVLTADAARFAAGAHELEVTAVFSRLRAPGRQWGPLDAGSLRKAVKALGGSCRFIGDSDVADEAAKEGLLEEVKRYPGGAPPHTGGVVFPLDHGPVMRRLVDGLTLSWSRLPDDCVELELSARFFLDFPDRVYWFTERTPAGHAP